MTAFRQSRSEQIIRVSAAEVPSKVSRVWWFDTVEMRPAHLEMAKAEISASTLSSYWLTILVFSNAGHGWSRSALKRRSTLEVPAMELTFKDVVADPALANAGLGVTLSIVYS